MQKPGKSVQLQELEKYSNIINSLPLKIYAKDTHGTFIHANDSYCRALGITRDELVGLDDYDIYPTDLADKYRSDDVRIMSSGKTEQIEERWQSLKGDDVWIQVIKAPLIGGDKTLVGTIGIFLNITERKIDELMVAEERNLLRTLIDNLPDYIYVKDADSRFIVANTSLAKLVGVETSDQLLGKTDHDFFSPDDADQFRENENQVISSGVAVVDVEESVTDSNGTEHYTKTTKVPLKGINDEIIGIIGIGRDFTEKRAAELARAKLEQQLHHAQKMETVGTLTAGISHDFNNMLSVINGYAEMMLLTSQENQKNTEMLGKILSAGRNAAKLVSQLLAFSRKQVAHSMVININQELRDMAEMLSHVCGEHIELEMRLAGELWAVRIDPAQLKQVVMNIVTNACDAMEGCGRIVIQTENVDDGQSLSRRSSGLPQGEWVELIITDTGPGISEEARNHLFEPFFTTKSQHEATGLGLATVFGIVKQNKGSVYADNCENAGAEFRIYLPKSNDPLSLTTTKNRDGCNTTLRINETILLVEHDPVVLTRAETILRNYGYTVYTAGNGAEALLLVEQYGKEIKLVLTDVTMPGMNGHILVREITRQWPGMKVICMSGYIDNAQGNCDGTIDESLAFVQIPFSEQELLRQVRSAIDGKD